MGRDALRAELEYIFQKHYVESADGWKYVIDDILKIPEIKYLTKTPK